MSRLRPINTFSPQNGVVVITSVGAVDGDGASKRPGRQASGKTSITFKVSEVR